MGEEKSMGFLRRSATVDGDELAALLDEAYQEGVRDAAEATGVELLKEDTFQ